MVSPRTFCAFATLGATIFVAFYANFSRSGGKKWPYRKITTADLDRLRAISLQQWVRSPMRSIWKLLVSKSFSSRSGIQPRHRTPPETDPRNTKAHHKDGLQRAAAFNDAGFPIATSLTTVSHAHRLLEVYPHPALLTLLTWQYRVPHKVGKTGSYWPDLALNERSGMLLTEFSAVHDARVNVLGPVGMKIPPAAEILTLSELKRYKDALGALICAWGGVRHVQGMTIGHGDENAAIWCPLDA